MKNFLSSFIRVDQLDPCHLCSVILFFICFTANAQSAYWQQEVNYKINVRLDDVKNELFADETVEYINNSPDDLGFLYFHLWPNAYKNNKTALGKQCIENGKLNFYYAKDADRGYIDQLEFKVDGQPVTVTYCGDSIDICKIFLNRPVKSGEHIVITTPFHVKIPLGEFSRLGHIEQQYQITQWYPKPAVYDARGWRPIPYLDQGEFYSEFGSYDVSITLPKNYVLGATGDMVDGEKEMEWLDKKVEETKGKDFSKKETIYVKGKKRVVDVYNDEFPPTDPEMKTLRFKQSKVHDFAWFCDKRYNVLKGEVELPHTKRKVTTWVMFTNGYGELWKKSIPYVNDALYYYSLWNGDYTYNQCTAVDGALSAGGGMEYPNITVIGGASNDMTLETVIMHEVGHNWFYGMLGSDERMHGWMDEGINSANENRYIRTKYPDALLIGDFNPKIGKMLDVMQYKHKAEYEQAYLINAKRNEDQPIEYPAWEYTELNYAGVMYSKTAIIFDYLRAYLGDSLYDKCGQAYFDAWCFKHPMPADVREVYERVSGKKLSWFFDDLINTTKKLDYRIVRVDRASGTFGGYSVTVKNTGEIAGPFCVSMINDGKVTHTIWHEEIKPGETIGVRFSSGNADAFRIDALGDMPESNRNNNISRVNGIFKKTEHVKMQFLGSLDDPEKTQLFFTPVVGWNMYNGLMAGAAFYNSIVPQKKVEWLLMPLYGTGNNNIAGNMQLALNMHPDKVFQTVKLGVNGARYAFADKPLEKEFSFNKIAPYLQFDIKKKSLRSPFSSTIKLREIGILRDYYTLRKNPDTSAFIDTYINVPKQDSLFVTELSYVFNADRNINPFNAGMSMQYSKYFTKLSVEANYEITLKGKNKGIWFRAFAGTFLDNSSPYSGKYAYHLSGISGAQDYLYDYVYLGRTETDGLWSRQFSETNGAFKANSAFASNDWVASLNVKATIPHIPVSLFGDVGTCSSNALGNDKVLYDAGVYLSVARGFLQIYLPLIMSNDLKEYGDNKDILRSIRFSLDFDLINPLNIIRNFSL
jgi:hypothetical protein